MRYEERGPEVNKKSKQARAQKMIRELRRLGYRVEPTTPPPSYGNLGGRFSTLPTIRPQKGLGFQSAVCVAGQTK
jgi:hypothetical protein